jgi:hypothetical protein
MLKITGFPEPVFHHGKEHLTHFIRLNNGDGVRQNRPMG